MEIRGSRCSNANDARTPARTTFLRNDVLRGSSGPIYEYNVRFYAERYGTESYSLARRRECAKGESDRRPNISLIYIRISSLAAPFYDSPLVYLIILIRVVSGLACCGIVERVWQELCSLCPARVVCCR